jgi:hypothetical protein
LGLTVFDQQGPREENSDLLAYAMQSLQLQHPSILRVVDVHMGADRGWRLIVAGLPRSILHISDIAQRLRDQGSACAIALSLAEAYAHLHRVGFRGGRTFSWEIEVVAVTQVPDEEWNLAMVPPSPFDIERGRCGGYLGNPRFSAPELLEQQMEGRPTEASDSYSLGAVLYQLLTRQPLISGRNMQEVFHAVLTAHYAPLKGLRPDLPDDLCAFVERSLAREPTSRPTLREWTFVMEKCGGRPLRLPPECRGPWPIAGVEPGPGYARVLGPSAQAVRLQPVQSLGTGATGSAFAAEIEPPKSAPGFGIPSPDRGQQEPVRPREAALPDQLRKASRDRHAEQPGSQSVDCSLFAPALGCAGDVLLVQAFFHIPEQRVQAAQLAKEIDSETRQAGYTPLEIELCPGDRLHAHLIWSGMEIDEPVQEILWQGRTAATQYTVIIPENHPPGNTPGKFEVYRQGIPVGRIKFLVRIEVPDPARTRPQATPLGQGRRYQQAFVSYASPDRSEVLKRVQLLAPLGIRYFQDLLSLEPGQLWEQELYHHIDQCDLFLLFWSSAAKVSHWVMAEVEYACNRQEANAEGWPDIVPMILEGPPVPEPPPWLQHIHFNDRLIYFWSR